MAEDGLREKYITDDEEDDYPLIKLSVEEKQQIREPWCQTLIISHGEENHYLTVKQWHPNFDPNEAMIDKIAVWVRLPDLALNGNFARICVEVDLMKPLLLSKFKLRRRPLVEVSMKVYILFAFNVDSMETKKDACLRK
ncbi:hypothetical protein NC652_029039 [Populus alba x Populus x berolinensis]|nr:hypothetical protein NC652_029039 [Populus alba x Populus x berolinensis]